MKRIDAIIRHFKLEDLKNALVELGVNGMTIHEVRGFGRQRGHTEMYRGTEYALDFVPKVVVVSLFVSDDEMPAIIDTIIHTTQTGQLGDGKIIVSEIENIVRIRTGEQGETAL